MHILLIHQYFLEDNAGGGSRWNEMARLWVEAGHLVTVIAGDVHYMQQRMGGRMNGKRFSVSTNRDGVEVIRCRVSERYHGGFAGRMLGYVSFAAAATYAGFRFARNTYDYVIVTSPPLFVGLPGLFLAKWKRVPLVLEVRDLWPESAIETGVLSNQWLIRLAYGFEKLLYKNAQLIIVLTPAFHEKLVGAKGIDSEKILLIPNAADFRLSEDVLADADIMALRVKLGLKGKFVLIYVGAHGLANGLMQIVGAAELLRDTNAHFVLLGDGMEKTALMRAVARRKLQNVTFLDPVPKAQVFEYILMADAGLSVLKKADVFKTVYSNKTFDYFSCKTPVIMAIDGISRELIEQANGGLFVEPENAEDLARKIRIYLNDTALARQHGESGYDFARMHFDRKVLASGFLKVLEDQMRDNRLRASF